MDIIKKEVKGFLNQHYDTQEVLLPFRKIGENNMIPIILKDTESILSMLLKLKKPVRILEIGTAIGYSAAFFAISCPNAEIYTIEKDEYAYTAAIRNLKKVGVSDRVHALFGEGQEQMEKLRDDGINDFDFVFIDAGKSHYKRFFQTAITICKNEAVIVSDNILMRGMTVYESNATEGKKRRKHNTARKNMKEYLEYISKCQNFSTTFLAEGDGMAVTIYNK